MTESSYNIDESRFDLQEMLKELESERISLVQKNVKQTDIAELFKKKSGQPKDGEPQ